jgi:EAL and modified HD-GYP domain-containing signal transduction protein
MFGHSRRFTWLWVGALIILRLGADGKAMDMYLARQPILDRAGKLFAYELLFRSDPIHNEFNGTESSAATLQVLANSLLAIGLDNILGGKKAFLNFGRALLLSGFASILPPETLVVEVLESVAPDAEVIAACRKLRTLGYSIALDDFVSDPRFDPLVALSSLIKVDMQSTGKREQERLLQAYKPRGIAMIAEKVETREEFDWAHRAGYDYFQGYFFARPVITRGQKIPAAKISCLRLLGEVQRIELNLDGVKEIVSQDVALSYTLLRYANSALFHFRTDIQSLEHALALIGEEGIRHWAALSALATLAEDKPHELITLSLVRGRFCEHLAQAVGVPNSGQAFLMGLFSFLDALLDLPLEHALGQVNIDTAIRQVLLGTAPAQSLFLRIHELVRQYELAHWDVVASLAHELNIRCQAITDAYRDSTLWAHQALHATSGSINGRHRGIRAANTEAHVM